MWSARLISCDDSLFDRIAGAWTAGWNTGMNAFGCMETLTRFLALHFLSRSNLGALLRRLHLSGNGAAAR
jgi:hypothetical protein